MRRFPLRRLKKVNMEALMVAAGQNIKRLLDAGRRGRDPFRRPRPCTFPNRRSTHQDAVPESVIGEYFDIEEGVCNKLAPLSKVQL
jgi:hypothetical protein